MTDRLANTAETLTHAVTELSGSVTGLAASQSRVKKVVTATVVGLVINFVLIAIAAFLTVNQRDINRRLSDASARIETVQVRTSDQVLCPLYALFIAFEPRAKDNPQFTEKERADRVHAYDVIHQGYTILGCH